MINTILHVTGVLVETCSLSISNWVSKAKSHDQKWQVSFSFETIQNHFGRFSIWKWFCKTNHMLQWLRVFETIFKTITFVQNYPIP